MFLSNSSALATDLRVLRDTSSPCVAVRRLAYTFPKHDAVGSSDTDGFSIPFPGVPNKFRHMNVLKGSFSLIHGLVPDLLSAEILINLVRLQGSMR